MTISTRPVYVLCFDGDEPAPAAPAPAAPPAPADPTPATPAAGSPDLEKKFSQADLNKFMAEDKRKHQEKFQQLEGSYQELLQNQSLTVEDRDKLQNKLADLQAANRTKEQQIEFDRKKAEEAYQKDLKEARQRGDQWESKYRSETMSRALYDAAAIPDVFNPAHVVALLRPDTELKEIEGQLVPMVNFADIDEKNGQEIRTLCTPADAVKRMQQLPKIHGNLFRSNVVAGVGAGQATVSATGDIDYQSMDAEGYRKNREAIKRRLG